MEGEDAAELQEELKKQCLEGVGYFIEPTYLFSSVIDRIKKKENILPILERSLKRIEDSTLGHDSEEDFGGLFSDIDLASPKLGKTADDKNTLVSNVLLALDDIKFGVEASEEIDILGDAYEYMIGQFALEPERKPGSSTRHRKSVRYWQKSYLLVMRGFGMCTTRLAVAARCFFVRQRWVMPWIFMGRKRTRQLTTLPE